MVPMPVTPSCKSHQQCIVQSSSTPCSRLRRSCRKGIAAVVTFAGIFGTSLAFYQTTPASMSVMERVLSARLQSSCPSRHTLASFVVPVQRKGRTGTLATLVLEPPAPPVTKAESDPRMSFALCRVHAAYRHITPCGSGDCTEAEEWRQDYETWIFRKCYVGDFDVLLRKMGYHLSMIYRNVSVQCEDMSLAELVLKTCEDCIRHLTSDNYGEMGMIIPAHPDDTVRGKTTAPALDAFRCLTEGKAYSASAPGAALFCRERQRDTA